MTNIGLFGIGIAGCLVLGIIVFGLIEVRKQNREYIDNLKHHNETLDSIVLRAKENIAFFKKNIWIKKETKESLIAREYQIIDRAKSCIEKNNRKIRS
jgi:hypothetical protein